MRNAGSAIVRMDRVCLIGGKNRLLSRTFPHLALPEISG
jgi:hypothetical protein